MIKHAFVSLKADDPDTTLIRPSNWNADHDLSGLVAADITDFDTAVLAVALPAGSDTEIQFNNAGAFGASSRLRVSIGTSSRMFLGDDGDSAFNFEGTSAAGAADGVSVLFQGGAGDSGNSVPAGVAVGAGLVSGEGGSISMDAGASTIGGQGAYLYVIGGGDLGTGGRIEAQCGNAGDTDQDGGGFSIALGTATGTGIPGQLIITNLPSSDPGIPGAVYHIAGALMISL